MNTSLNFYQIAGNDISKLKWRRKQSYSWEGDNGEVLLVSGDKSQQSWVPAFPWACEAHTGKHRLGQPRVLSAASQQQNYGCKPAAPVLHQPLCLWQCRNTFPRAPSQRHSENTFKKSLNGFWQSAGVFSNFGTITQKEKKWIAKSYSSWATRALWLLLYPDWLSQCKYTRESSLTPSNWEDLACHRQAFPQLLNVVSFLTAVGWSFFSGSSYDFFPSVP